MARLIDTNELRPDFRLGGVMRRLAPGGTGIFAHRELWATLAHLDLRNRYRGSFLGPLWLTIATGVLVAGIGLLYGGLFRQPLETYLPYVAVSLVAWTLISSTITEAAVLFPGEGIVLKQLPVPSTIFTIRLVYRNLLAFAHNLIIVAIVYAIYPDDLSATALFVLISFPFLVVNLWWVSVVVSLTAARFRDIPPIVVSALQILFFVSPIVWSAEDLPSRTLFVSFNPLYHLIESVRAPLTEGEVPWTSFGFSVGCALVGSLLALHLLAWARTRLVYWL